MKISIEELIEIVTREVIKELLKKGVKIDFDSPDENVIGSNRNVKEIDMSGYKTPVLTENHLDELNNGITEIIIPKKTVITPGARIVIKTKQLIITYSNKNKGE